MTVPIGLLLWAVLGLAWAAGAVTLDVVRLMLALALLVVVPLGLDLHPRGHWSRAALVTGGFATLSLVLPQGPIAGALALPTVALAVVVALRALNGWWSEHRDVIDLGATAALGYLVVGAVWLVVDRLAVEPVGVRPPFVVLTAIHFHYAGFAATVIAALVERRTGIRGGRVGLLAVALSPPLVAIGFTSIPVLQIVGAVILTAGLWLVAWATVRHVLPVPDPMTRVLLTVSSLAVLVPMVLAVQWAVGWNFGTPALSIPAMARTHGVVNAVGFTLCGLLGWHRVGRGEGLSGDAP